GEPVHLGRGAPRDQGEVQDVDVDGDVDRLARGQAVDDALRAVAAQGGDGDDVVAARPRGGHVGLARPEAPDGPLDDVVAVAELGHVPDRIAVGPLHTVDERPVVQVGVEVDDVEPLAVRPHHRVGDGVVAADDDWEDAGGEDAADVPGDVGERALDVGVDDVRVAAVHDAAMAALVLEVAPVLLDVVVAELPLGGAVPRVLHGQLTDLPGGEAGPRLPRRALVGRRAPGPAGRGPGTWARA